MNNNWNNSLQELPWTIYFSGIKDPNKIAKIKNGNKIECFFRTDDMINIWKKFSWELQNDSITRENIPEMIIEKLEELIKELKESTTYKFYKPTSVFPIKSTVEDDSSLIWMITDNPHQKIMLKKNPEYILHILDIWHEYFWIMRPIQELSTYEPPTHQPKNWTPSNPHLEYACEFVKKSMRILELNSSHFDEYNGILRLSTEWKKLAQIPNIIEKIQDAYENSQLLSK